MNTVFSTYAKQFGFYCFLQSVLGYFSYYLYYFNAWCESDKKAHNLPWSYLALNNDKKESEEVCNCDILFSTWIAFFWIHPPLVVCLC